MNKYGLILTCTVLVSLCAMHGYAELQMSEVTACFEDTNNVTYLCGKYDPEEELQLFGDGINRFDSPINIVRSQYTQMYGGSWTNFVLLWDDFYAPYTLIGIPAPSSETFVSAWSDILTDTRSYLSYKVLFGEYVIFVIDTKLLNGDFVVRAVSTIKPVGSEYRLTRDLSLESNPLEQVLDNSRFNAEVGALSIASIAGSVNYEGNKSGSVHVAVVRAATSNNWDTACSVELSTPGEYCITNVVLEYSYVVQAYLDVDTNNVFSQEEPYGVYTNNPIYPYQDMTNILIILQDPQE